MRRALVALVSIGVVGTAVPALSTTDPFPQILDQASDANGVNGQWYDYGTVGRVVWFVYNLGFGGDPFEEGVQTEQSYAPADLRQARLETMFEAVPVGEDGIDYRATGVRLRMTTEEPAAAPDNTTMSLGLYLTQYTASSEDCPTRIATRIEGSGDPGPVRWFRDSVNACESAESAPATEIPGFRAFRDGGDVVIEMPAIALPGTAGSYFSEGATFLEPKAFAQVEGVTLDASRPGSDFRVGQDMPEDVPCTKGCPAS